MIFLGYDFFLLKALVVKDTCDENDFHVKLMELMLAVQVLIVNDKVIKKIKPSEHIAQHKFGVAIILITSRNP